MESQDFETWHLAFQQEVEASGTHLRFLLPTEEFMYNQGYSPKRALQVAMFLAKQVGAIGESEDYPYDESAEIAKGKRVRKIKSDHGDLTNTGAEGITVGYKVISSTYQMYFVEWDDHKGTLNGVRSTSLEEIL